jgi:RNA polymerase sigma factor (sigma-70 family)
LAFFHIGNRISAPAETLLVAMMRRKPPDQPADSAKAMKIDWSVVLVEHDRWLRTIVFARVGEPEAVDEVMQEVSMAAVRQRAPISDAGKVAPWLYRLAVTQSLLYRRKQGRRRKLTDRYAERNRPVEGDNREMDPLGWLLADERRKLIRVAVSRLPKRDAELLLLKYTEDWSYQDLAEHLGVTPSAVESRLHRARQRLRSELTALEVVETES